jgi:hypothetical protein
MGGFIKDNLKISKRKEKENLFMINMVFNMKEIGLLIFQMDLEDKYGEKITRVQLMKGSF